MEEREDSAASNERVVRVLVLDGDRDPWPSRMEGFEVKATFEGRLSLIVEDLGYYLSGYSLSLAETATPELYDAVIIGNNEGYGVRKAQALPRELRARTLIVWNHRMAGGGEESVYSAMGYTRFGQRRSDTHCLLGVTEFLREVAIEKYGE